MDLEEFIQQNQKRKSVFDPYKSDIIKMVKGGVSQENILIWIRKKSKNKITRGLTQGNLSQYISRLKKQVKQKKESQGYNQKVDTNNTKNEVTQNINNQSPQNNSSENQEETSKPKSKIKRYVVENQKRTTIKDLDERKKTITHNPDPSFARNNLY